MERVHALMITGAVMLLLASNYFFLRGIIDPEREPVIVARAIDGDTVELDDGRIVRLVNINTPEKKEPGYDDARTFLEQFEGMTVELEVRGTERYGRTLGAMYAPDYVNLAIIEQGLASTLLVEDDETRLFAEAQDRAFENEEGIWKRSSFYGCLDAEINKKEEYVVFTRTCSSSVEGWIVKDETTNDYTLPDIQEPTFTLYSAIGTRQGSDLYWGRTNAWNNDRDSLIVRDQNGLLVLFQRYGY